VQPDCQAIFAIVDASGDGRISKEEFINYYLANY
jgi:Ca2+-binding EF-hand superfamily protein